MSVKAYKFRIYTKPEHIQNKYIITFQSMKRGIIMQRDMIQSDPGIMMGKPVIAGTRITVELILEKFAAGENIEQIIGEYPN